MKGVYYTIINPRKYMTHNYLRDRLINYGFPEEAVSISLITKEEMTIEAELYFKMTEVGNKFYDRFNGKSFGLGNNYKLNIKEGKSDKESEISKNKEIKYIHNYPSWVYTHYAIKLNEEGLILINPIQKDIQKKMISHIMSKINSPYIKGQNIFNFTFPVSVCDKRTLLQVLACEFRESPYILDKIYFLQDPIEKLKTMTSFLISQLYLTILRIMPFNPLLGETYQVKIANLNCYFEQTNVNPPTTNIYCFDTDNLYKIYGYISIHTKIGINNIKIIKLGNIYIDYQNGNKYKIFYPSYYVGGITIGKRNFNVTNCSLILDLANRLVSYINFSKPKDSNNEYNRPDIFYGKLISLNEVKIDTKGANHQILEEDTIPLAELDGEWTRVLNFGEKTYWRRKENNLAKMFEMDYILKSDSSLRKDLILYNENKIDEADKALNEYVNIQLNDALRRKNYNKNVNNK